MNFKVRTTADSVTAELTGRLEFTDHDRLHEVVALLDRPGLKRFAVDLEGLSFIDSAGLGILLILQEEADHKQIPMVVRRPRDDVKRSIELAKISEMITIEY